MSPIKLEFPEYAARAIDLPSVAIMDLYAQHRELLHEVSPLDQTVKAYRRGDPWPQIGRETAFPHAHLNIHFLVKAWELMEEAGIKPEVAYFGAGMSTTGHIADLQRFDYQNAGYDYSPQLLTTKTTLYRADNDRTLLVLISGLGQFQVDDEIDRDIITLLGATGRPGHNHTINPDPKVFETDWLIGHAIGMVKPIILDSLVHNVTAIYYRRPQNVRPEDPVAITASPFEMVILPRWAWEETFEWYARTFYHGSIKIQGSDFDLFFPQPTVGKTTI